MIEACLVSLMLSVLAAFALPNLRLLSDRLQLQAAAQQVAADLRLARVRAISQQTSCRLLFRAGEATYRRQSKDVGGYHDDESAISLPSGVRTLSCSSTTGALGFRAQGLASEFGTLILANDSQDQKKLVVDLVGEVRLE